MTLPKHSEGSLIFNNNNRRQEQTRIEYPLCTQVRQQWQGEQQKVRHKKKNHNGGKTVTVVSTYTINTEEFKVHIFLQSREKFLGYATTKFGNDVSWTNKSTAGHLNENQLLGHLVALLNARK